MLDVLLTHSYHLYSDRKQVRKMQPYPPLGTLYAAALLRQAGISVALFDSMIEDPAEGFPEAVRTLRPKVIAIYEDNFNFLSKMCLTRMRQIAFEMIEMGRASGAKVIVHGSDFTDHSAEYLARGADFVLMGEAEQTLLEIVECVLGKIDCDPGRIPGIAYLSPASGAITCSPRRALRSDLDILPLPARDLVDLEHYRQLWQEAHGFFSLNLVASRGCPYRCNWCAKPIYGDSFHARTPANVAEEMQQLRSQFGADHLWFADDLFGINSRWLQGFGEEVSRRRAAIPFKVQSRADLMSKAEAVAALAQAGCVEVWLGAESGSQKILDSMDKGIRVDQIVRAAENLREYGIRACFFLQFGYPGETWADIRNTIELVRATRPDDIGVSVAYPLPGTKFYQRVREQLSAKRNWVDSEDLSMMFRGAYSSEFYRAVRDALHAEVNSWSSTKEWKFSLCERTDPDVTADVDQLWSRVDQMERVCRNVNATELPVLVCSAAGCD